MAEVQVQHPTKCPAFENGCPYKDSAAKYHEELKKCPAFKDGKCPFHGMSVAEVLAQHKDHPNSNLKELAGKCPAFKEGKCPFASSYENLKNESKQCPEFKSGCPFAEAAHHTGSHEMFGAVTMTTEELAKVCPHFAVR